MLKHKVFQQSVLIVDDYGTMRRIIHNFLTQIGFKNIDEASDGMTALQKLKERYFGLMIMDWNMEPMNGLQLLKEIIADTSLELLPFIIMMMTSGDEEAARRTSVRNIMKPFDEAAGECDSVRYIIKPFNADTLRKTIEDIFEKL